MSEARSPSPTHILEQHFDEYGSSKNALIFLRKKSQLYEVDHI
jgi:hypothetical protein